MKEFITGLGQAMSARLEAVNPDEDNILKTLIEKIAIVSQANTELKAFILSYAFKDGAEEIDFFKRLLPPIFAELLYYKRLLDLEVGSPLSREERKYYLEKELDRVGYFLRRKHTWVTYYRTGAEYLDEKYFVRGTASTDPDLLGHTLTSDTRFCTTGSMIFSRIICAEKLTRRLEEEIALLMNPYASEKQKPSFGLRWTGPQIYLIELTYALYASGFFNDGKIEHVKQIADWLQQTLKVDLGNYYRIFQGIRIRKKIRTKCLDELKDKVIEYMDNQDINPRYS